MKLHTSITAVSLLGLTMISSNAYSGTESGTTGDSLQRTCRSCNQIPMPKLMCSSWDAISVYCGSEDWLHNGNQDCKRFMTVTQYCSNGGSQTFTVEYWAGAGFYCNPGDNPDCQE